MSLCFLCACVSIFNSDWKIITKLDVKVIIVHLNLVYFNSLESVEVPITVV
jgi:hypothetical protein